MNREETINHMKRVLSYINTLPVVHYETPRLPVEGHVYNQACWWNDENPCGTEACLAGWTCALLGKRLPVDLEETADWAIDALGLSNPKTQAERIALRLVEEAFDTFSPVVALASFENAIITLEEENN